MSFLAIASLDSLAVAGLGVPPGSVPAAAPFCLAGSCSGIFLFGFPDPTLQDHSLSESNVNTYQFFVKVDNLYICKGYLILVLINIGDQRLHGRSSLLNFSFDELTLPAVLVP